MHALFIIASVLPARSAIAATISNVILIGDLACKSRSASDVSSFK